MKHMLARSRFSFISIDHCVMCFDAVYRLAFARHETYICVHMYIACCMLKYVFERILSCFIILVHQKTHGVNLMNGLNKKSMFKQHFLDILT